MREHDLPPDWASFRAYLDNMVAERLERNETVDLVLDTLARPARPPLRLLSDQVWRLLRVPPAHALRLATVGLMPPALRQRLGLRWTAGQEAEFRAVGAASRALTALMPARLRVMGPDWLRWRSREIAEDYRLAPPVPGTRAA